MSQDPLFGDSVLCHPIIKYSWTTGPRSAKDTPWTHVEAPNLHVLVQHIQFGTAIRLRIIRDTTDLEYLPLTTFIQEANTFGGRYSEAHLDDLPIFAMTRGSALAIRYTCENDRVRRFQIRFANLASCQEMIRLLVHHGLKFGKLNSEPSTVQPQARPKPIGSYSQSSHTGPLASSVITVPHISREQNQYGVMEQQGNYHSDRPSSSHKACPERASSPPLPSSSPKVPHIEQQQYGMTGQQVNFESDMYYSESVARPSSVPSLTSREDSIRERPMTAPNQQPPATPEAMLPPRRELPFPRPSTSSGIPGNPSNGSKARPSKAFRPLPTPSYAQNLRSSSTMAHLSPETRASTESYAHGASSSPTLNDPTQVNDGPTSTLSSEPGGPKSTPQRRRITLTPSGPWKFDPPANRNYHPLKEAYHSSVFNPSSTKSTTGGGSGSPLLTSDYSEHVPSSPLRTSMRSDQYMQDPIAVVDNALPVDTDDREQFKRYSEQTPEVRQEMLENFLVSHLDDPEFISLCEDVGACWRRKVLDRRD